MIFNIRPCLHIRFTFDFRWKTRNKFTFRCHFFTLVCGNMLPCCSRQKGVCQCTWQCTSLLLKGTLTTFFNVTAVLTHQDRHIQIKLADRLTKWWGDEWVSDFLWKFLTKTEISWQKIFSALGCCFAAFVVWRFKNLLLNTFFLLFR